MVPYARFISVEMQGVVCGKLLIEYQLHEVAVVQVTHRCRGGIRISPIVKSGRFRGKDRSFRWP